MHPAQVIRRVIIGATLLIPHFAQAQSLAFTSDPPGARVCQKSGGALTCLGKTPLNHEVEFRGPNDSKRFFFKKLGYQTDSVVLSIGSRSASMRLKPRDILFPVDEHDDLRLKKLQGEVNALLTPLIYGPVSGLSGVDGEIVGKIKVANDGRGFLLFVGLLVESDEQRRRILAARRSQEIDRSERIARAVMDGSPAELLSLLSVKLRGLELDRLVLSIDYQVSQASVVDETLHQYRTQVTSQYIRTYADGKRELVTEYKITRHEYEVAKVQDDLAVRTLLVEIGSANVTERRIDDVLRGARLYSNDNRHKKFELVGGN